MELREMYDFMRDCREDFREALKIKNERKRQRLLNKMVLASYEECGSQFEQETLVEVYREEVREWRLSTMPA